MRENESDGEGGWRQPDAYVSPWAQPDEGHDEDEAARTRWPGANPASPPENGHQDTIAFGAPAGSSGGDDRSSYVQPGYGDQPDHGNHPGYGNQPGYGQAWYGSQDNYGTQAGHQGQSGYQSQGGGGDPGGHQAGGGYGAPGWTQPDPPPGRSRRGRHFLVYVAIAVVAASIGAGITVAVGSHGAAPAAGISSNDVPGPHGNAAGSGSSSAPLNPAAVAKKVDPAWSTSPRRSSTAARRPKVPG
jgi:hypothetical protein